MAEQAQAKEELSTADNFVQIFLIELEIKKATDLKKADTFGKSDPYCRVSAFGQTYTTKTIIKTLNPVWNEKSQFVFFDDPKALKFEVWDWDKGTKDDPIGEVSLPVSALFTEGSPGFDGELKLQNVKKGSVHVSVKGRRLLPVALEKRAMELEALEAKQTNEIAENDRLINELKESNDGLKQENHTLETENSGLEQTKEKLTNDYESLKEEESVLQNKINELNEEKSKLNSNLNELKEKEKTITIELNKINDKLNNEREEEKRLNDEIRETQSNLTEKERLLEDLDRELEEAKRKPSQKPTSPGINKKKKAKTDTKTNTKTKTKDTSGTDNAGEIKTDASDPKPADDDSGGGCCSCCLVM